MITERKRNFHPSHRTSMHFGLFTFSVLLRAGRVQWLLSSASASRVGHYGAIQMYYYICLGGWRW